MLELEDNSAADPATCTPSQHSSLALNPFAPHGGTAALARRAEEGRTSQSKLTNASLARPTMMPAAPAESVWSARHTRAREW